VIEQRRPAHPPVLPDRSALDAVVFDVGGVFVMRHPEPVRTALGELGLDVPADPQHYRRAHHHGVRAMSDLVVRTGPVDEYDPHLWRYWELAYLRHLGVPEDRLEEAAHHLVAAAATLPVAQVWRLVLAENVEGLHRIIASGMPVAVVSNNDGTAEEQLRLFGVCQVGPGPLPSITCVVDSGVVGVAKPDPTIFAPALAALGTVAARTLYVGDTVHADVHGATAAGMPVIQLDPYQLHTDHDHLRLPDLTALADLLGTATTS